jgi:hypothetical protein
MTTATAKVQLAAAGLAVATAAAFTPLIAQADTFSLAPEFDTSAQVLIWGSDDLDPALLAQLNEAAAPSAAAVTATPIADLIRSLVQSIGLAVQGVVRGTTVVVGTTVYATLAFTGGVLTTVGNILPGPIGNVFTNVGDATTNAAIEVARALRVGPYGTVA